jgi:hypothetical protein
MKHLLFLLIISSTLTSYKTKKQENKALLNDLPLKIYSENSRLPAAIMGYRTKEGKKTWYAFGPSIWGGRDSINENNIFRIYSMTKAIASVAAWQLVEQDLIAR